MRMCCVYMCMHEHFHIAYMCKIEFLFFPPVSLLPIYSTQSSQVDLVQFISHISLLNLTWSQTLLPTRGWLCLPLPPVSCTSLSSHWCHPEALSLSLLTLEQWCHLFWRNGLESEEPCWMSAATWPSCTAPLPDHLCQCALSTVLWECLPLGCIWNRTELAEVQVQSSHQGTSKHLL